MFTWMNTVIACNSNCMNPERN